jgi:hypothetical protein
MFEGREGSEGGVSADYVRTVDARIAELESTLRNMQGTIDQQNREMERSLHQFPSLPNTKLLSNDYFPRAFAVWGHYFVANLIIGLAVAIMFTCLLLVLGVSLSELF